MIKRKWFNRAEVKTILEKEVKIAYRDDSLFKGYVSLLNIKKVKETTFVNICGKNRCVLKNGHSWLQLLEEGAGHSIIAIYNENNVLIEWYVDIILGQGLEKNKMPYYDDLFLDVVIFRDGEMTLVDEDELLEALNEKEITKEEFDFAYEEAKKVLHRFKGNIENELHYAEEMREFLLNSKEIEIK